MSEVTSRMSVATSERDLLVRQQEQQALHSACNHTHTTVTAIPLFRM